MVERKMKEAQRKADKDARMESMAREEMGKIESLARKQFAEDLREIGEPSAQPAGYSTSQRRPPGAERVEAEAEADLEIKQAAERAYRVEQTGASDTNDEWEYDHESGYYISRALSCYYDGHSGYYYHGDPPSWQQHPPAKAPSEDAARFEKFYSDAPDDLQDGAQGPLQAAAAVAQSQTMGQGLASRHVRPQAQAFQNNKSSSKTSHDKNSSQLRVVKPIQKVQQRSNNALGGYQLPLYSGSVGAAKNLGRTTVAGSGNKSSLKGKGGAVPKPAKKGPKNTDEDKALSAREAARKRVEARTLNNFGFQ